jgi:hypothetical protein
MQLVLVSRHSAVGKCEATAELPTHYAPRHKHQELFGLAYR